MDRHRPFAYCRLMTLDNYNCSSLDTKARQWCVIILHVRPGLLQHQTQPSKGHTCEIFTDLLEISEGNVTKDSTFEIDRVSVIVPSDKEDRLGIVLLMLNPKELFWDRGR